MNVPDRHASSVGVWSIWVTCSGAAVAAVGLSTAWLRYNPQNLSTGPAISEVARFSVLILALTAASGFAAMAAIEMLKRLLHLRGRYFLVAIERSFGGIFLYLTIRTNSGDLHPRRSDVLRLDLPLEQLVAQLSYAIDGALETIADPRPVDTEHGRRAHLLLAALLPPHPGQEGEGINFSDRDPTVLRGETQAALDDLQVRIGNAWRWRLHLWSCFLALMFTALALLFVPGPPPTKLAALGASLVFGGFFAGFFRDLVAVVERARRT